MTWGLAISWPNSIHDILFHACSACKSRTRPCATSSADMSQPEVPAGAQNAFTLLMRASSSGSSKRKKQPERSQQPQAKRQRSRDSDGQHRAAGSSQQDHNKLPHAATSACQQWSCCASQPHGEASLPQHAQPVHLEQDEPLQSACTQQGRQHAQQQSKEEEQLQQLQLQQQVAMDAFRRAFSTGGGIGVRPQPFQHYLVLDLEATCNRARNLNPVEIIEVSAVLLEVTLQGQCQLTREFTSFVRPDQHPVLDPFVTELTGITQQQVDAAPPLQEVLVSLDRWLQAQGLLDEGASFAPVTWTSWDLKIAVETECKWRGIEVPWYFRRWVDLKRHYLNKYKKAGNLRSCVEAAGLEWTGHAHSGIDDARNTARLAMKLLQQGVRLTITEQFEQAGASTSSRGTAAAPTGAAAGSTRPAVAGAAAGAVKRQHSGSGGGNGSMRQALLAPRKAALNPVDAQGNWNGLCKCGIKAATRVTKKPGQNHGRSFFSCGNWRITQQGRACDFFLWAEESQRQNAAAT